MYVVPKNNDISVEGFFRKKGFFLKKEEKAFCFKVKHLKGKKLNVCVPNAYSGKPNVKVEITPEKVILHLEKGKTYRLYPYKEGIVPYPLGEFQKTVIIGRDFKEKIYALTEVFEDFESQPFVIRIPPKEAPVPPKPQDLSYVVRGGKIYLYWRAKEEAEGFLVYRNGKLLTEKPIRGNVFVEDLPTEEALYEVISVNRFGKKSSPAIVRYSP